jgi:hypothetical protein
MLIFRRGLFGSLCQFSPAARKRQRFWTAVRSIVNHTLEQEGGSFGVSKEKRRQDTGATGGKRFWEHCKTISRLYRQFMWQ